MERYLLIWLNDTQLVGAGTPTCAATTGRGILLTAATGKLVDIGVA